MKKKRTLILGLQLCLLVVTAISFMTYTQNQVKPMKAYVFNKDMKVNQKITAADVNEVSIPSSAVTSDFALDPKEFVDKYVNTKVYANTFLYDKQIVEEGKLDPFESMDLTKYRKISLPLTYVEGFGGDIHRGDKVDIVFTGEGKKKDEEGVESNFKYSKAFLQNILVYSLSTADGYEFVDHSTGDVTKNVAGEKIDTSSSSDELAVVTLAVTLDQAEEITARMSSGKLQLVSRFDQNDSYETLGFVLGDYKKVYSAPINAETGRSTINEKQ